MRYELSRLIPSLLFLLAFGLIGWVGACRPAVAGAPADQAQPYTFYLYPWTENDNENRLIPLDPETLVDRPKGQTMELGRSWRLSPDGSTLVNVEYPEGRASQDLEDRWIVVYDFQNGTERNRFHPPASGLISGLSQDGTRLLLQVDAYPYTQSPYPPTVEWYVVDTTSGQLLAHIKDDDNACFGQSAYADPAMRRIYCVVDPAITARDEPEPMRIVAYNVESGIKAEELELPQVLIGGENSDQIIKSQPVWVFFEPTLVISPDGQRLAAVHADADEITLVDAHSLTVENTFSLRRDTNLWDWFGLAPAPAHAKGEAQGTIRHAAFSFDGQHLYVFSQEVWVKLEDAPAERGLWLVDLAQEQIVAEALPDYQIQWLRPVPDGTVYAFGTTDERLLPYEIRTTSPSMLWRLHGRTLEILAERPFTGYQGGRIVLAGE
jgi:hypothetical protein